MNDEDYKRILFYRKLLVELYRLLPPDVRLDYQGGVSRLGDATYMHGCPPVALHVSQQAATPVKLPGEMPPVHELTAWAKPHALAWYAEIVRAHPQPWRAFAAQVIEGSSHDEAVCVYGVVPRGSHEG